MCIEHFLGYTMFAVHCSDNNVMTGCNFSFVKLKSVATHTLIILLFHSDVWVVISLLSVGNNVECCLQ